MKALNPEWYNWGPIAELSGSLDERMFKYLRSLEYKGSVDDMLYEYLLDQGLTGSLSDMLYSFTLTVPNLPEGFVFLVDDEENYLVDDNGDYLITETA